jgi:xylulokinase
MQDTPAILTVDVGTGSVRAGLVTLDGRVRALHSVAHATHHPRHGWAEQDPEVWWRGACSAIGRTLSEGGTAGVIGIACCGQMHAPVLIDGVGKPVRPMSPLWNDKRAAGLADGLADRIRLAGLPPPANPPTSAWPGVKLAWTAANEPEILSRSRCLLMPKDWINFRLTGEVAMDWTEAGSSFLSDADTGDWSADLARLVGIDPDILPPLLPSTHRVGTVTAAAATATGLPCGLPVLVGAGDFPAAILGSGVTRPGAVSDITGTSFLLTCLRADPLRDPQIMNVALASGGWGAFAVVDAAGDAIRWASRTLDDGRHTYEQLSHQAATVAPGAEGLLFLPYLTGERLGQGALSRAAFLGLTAHHRPAHLHRAVMEGVILAMNEAYAPIMARTGRPETIVAAAGGARSDLWLSIKADVFGCPVIVPEEPEAGLLGAASIGFAGLGHFPDAGAAAQALVRVRPPIDPDPSRHARYQDILLAFRKVRETMPLLNSALAALS